MYALLGLGALVLLYLLVSRPSDTTVYSIMMDAGSTGSRIHVYKFIRETDAGGSPLTLQSEVFEQLKPGLSAYATNPSRGAESLLPLLKAGADAIPDDLEPSTVSAGHGDVCAVRAVPASLQATPSCLSVRSPPGSRGLASLR